MQYKILKRSILVILIIGICTPIVSAQKKKTTKWNARKYEAHIGLGLTNFMGDICSPRKTDAFVWVVPFKTTGYTADAMLKYNLGGRHYVGSSVFMGYMAARETIQKQTKYYYRDGIAFKSFFTEISARYEFQIIRERRRRTIYRQLGETRLKNTTFPSYIFAGAGGIFNIGNIYWNDAKGLERFSKGYMNIAPVVMGGLGTKLRIDRNTYIGVEAGWRVALSDGIDNCNGNKPYDESKPWTKHHYGKWIDQYQFVTVSLVVSMREKRNHMPNFRTIRR